MGGHGGNEANPPRRRATASVVETVDCPGEGSTPIADSPIPCPDIVPVPKRAKLPQEPVRVKEVAAIVDHMSNSLHHLSMSARAKELGYKSITDAKRAIKASAWFGYDVVRRFTARLISSAALSCGSTDTVDESRTMTTYARRRKYDEAQQLMRVEIPVETDNANIPDQYDDVNWVTANTQDYGISPRMGGGDEAAVF